MDWKRFAMTIFATVAASAIYEWQVRPAIAERRQRNRPNQGNTTPDQPDEAGWYNFWS